MSPTLGTYWKFYWPLALTGLAMVLSLQFQNAALARYPDAVTELAVFALAQGTFSFFNAAINFIPQLSNVYARTGANRRTTRRFVWLACAVLSVPLLWLALLPSGHWVIRSAYGIDETLLARVTEYLLLLSPLVLINGQRHFVTGMLVQARLTGWVTTLNGIYLGTIVVVLVAGFRAGLTPVHTLVGAQVVAAVLHLILTLAVHRHRYRSPEPDDPRVGFRELTAFFVPVTTTGVMFALSRPVLYAFVARTPDALLNIAALRVAFDFSMMFQQAANQFRHFFVTFGLDDLPGKRRFMALVATGITAVMLAVATTPLSDWLLGDLMGIRDDVRHRAVEVILIMCLLPTIIIVRNYFHGTLMVHRRTGGMAYGGMLRVLGIFLAAMALGASGHLTHVSAAFVLLMGFVIETLVVVRSCVRLRGARAPATA